MPKPATEHSDDQILALMHQRGGMEKGFRLMVEKYQERVYWQVRRLVMDHEDANDVVQNCFIKAYRGIKQFQGKSQLFTWLYRIATNEAITFLKRQERNATSTLDDEHNGLANQLKADAYFDGDEIQVLLQKALQSLPEKQRAVFHLRYYEEMAYQDMAKVLDTSVGALKASYHHAVKKIEHYIKNIEV